MKTKYKMVRMHPKEHRLLTEIARQRWASGRDSRRPRPLPLWRISLGRLNHMRHKEIEEDLKKADMPDDKVTWDDRGQILGNMQSFSILTIGIIAFLTIMFLAGIMYATGLLNDVFTEVGLNNEANSHGTIYVNLTQASQDTFGKVDEATQGIKLVGIAIIFALILGNLLMSFFVRQHPAMFFVYVLLVLLALFLAVPISNGYESVKAGNPFDGALDEFTALDWILLNLPTTVLIIGILGCIFMFANIIRSPSEGSLQ